MHTKTWWITLTAGLTLLFVQVFRVSTVIILNNVAERNGYTEAAVAMSVMMLAPLGLIVLTRVFSAKRLFLACVIALLAVRLALQATLASNTLVTPLTVAGVILALCAFALWIVLVRSQFSPAESATVIVAGMVSGFVVDSALFSAFLLWDYIWQTSLVAYAIALLVTVIMMVIVWRVWVDLPSSIPHWGWWDVSPLVLLMPFMMLHILILHNPGYISAASSAPLPGILVILAVVIDAPALILTNSRHTMTLPVLVIGTIVIFVAELGLLYAGGMIFLLILIALHFLVVLILCAALGNSHEAIQVNGLDGAWKAIFAIIGGNVLLSVLGGGYFASSTVRLPYSVPVLLLLGAAVWAMVIFLLIRGEKVTFRKLSAASPVLLLLLVALILAIVLPEPQTDDFSGDTFRVMSYNVRYGVDADGIVDLNALVEAIEAQNVDVILLQEVARGVMTGGGVDMATWLSARLEMNFVYAPTRDWQIGNVILSRFPLDHWDYEALPVPEDKTRRSVLSGVYHIGNQQVTIINTHLSVGIPSSERSAEVQAVLDHWNSAPLTIIGGDMNTFPAREDILLFNAAGFISAQDEVGDPDEATYNSTEPLFRIDWIFGTPDLTFVDFDIPATTASDHLPLVATVRLSVGE